MRNTFGLVVILCLLVIACQPSNSTNTPGANSASAEKSGELKRYPLKGTIVSVDAGAHKATINHGEIPGFMGAMTMAYPIKNDAELQSVASGDEITADVVVDPNDNMWVEKVTVVKKAEGKP